MIPRSRKPPRRRGWSRRAGSCSCRSWPRSASSSCGSRPRVRRAARVGDTPSRGLDRLRDRLRCRLCSRLPSTSLLATAQFALRSAFDLGERSCRSSATRRSAAAFSTSSSLRALRARSGCSRSGSTGPSARNGRSPSCSRARARCSPPLRRLLVPGLSGHAGQTSPRGLSLALRLAPPRRRLGLDRRADRAARALVEPPGRATRRRPRGLRTEVLQHGLRLGPGADRLRHRRFLFTPAHARFVSGRPPTARPCSSRSGCSASHCCSRR